MGFRFFNSSGAQKAVTASSVELPAGTVMDFAGAAAPTGWVVCDGSAISRTTYSALFSVIGTTYGVGDGSTTFNVPDARGRASVAPDSGAGRVTTDNTLAAASGAQTHTLTAAEGGAAIHSHGNTFSATGTEGAHTHTGSFSGTFGWNRITNNTTGGAGNAVTGIQNSPGAFADQTVTTSGTTSGGSSHSHTVSGSVSNSTGTAGVAHNNLQPYIVLNKIIKV
jgi:microcystin-dependent protein